MRRRGTKGQLLVEFVLGLSGWTVLIAGFLSLVQICLLRQRAQAGARLGALILSTGRVTDETVRIELLNYLAQTTSVDGIEWTVDLRRYLDTAAARFYHLVQTEVTGRGRTWRVAERMVVEQEKKEP